MPKFRGIVGYFKDVDSLRAAIDGAKAARLEPYTAYLPLPDDTELEAADEGDSPARFFALAGGIFGICLALLMTIACSWQYPLVVGGKSITSWPPFLVISFELMVLFGTFGALTGFLVLSQLPHVIPEPGYRPDVAVDTYALYLPCSESGGYRQAVERVLEDAHAEEIRAMY